ncbi:MAG: hypothetical protein OXN81_07410 [Alphaproteobacteria bacterium]|nr:hypothetical protein [Alphaproteobacteria bacterium]
MSDDPLKLMLDRLDAIVASNEETRKAVEASNAETRKAIRDMLAQLREAISDRIAKQDRAFGEMRAGHAETLKAARAAPAWAVMRGVLYVTGGLAVLILLAGLILQAAGQVHIAVGPATGFCATAPVEQPNGGHACWETPPQDKEDAERLETCLEPSFVSRNQGRRACWLDPPPPKPAPEQDG